MKSKVPPSIEPENMCFNWLGFLAIHEIASTCPSIAPIKGLAKI